MTNTTELSEETSDLSSLYPQVHEALGDMNVRLDSSAFSLMDEARKIALALGFHYIDPAHIVLARLVKIYSQQLKKDAQPALRFTAIIQKTSPQTGIFEIDANKVIPLSPTTEGILLKASSKSVGRISGPEIITYAGETKDIFSRSLAEIENRGKRQELASRIARVIDFITPKPIFGQKTA